MFFVLAGSFLFAALKHDGLARALLTYYVFLIALIVIILGLAHTPFSALAHGLLLIAMGNWIYYRKFGSFTVWFLLILFVMTPCAALSINAWTYNAPVWRVAAGEFTAQEYFAALAVLLALVPVTKFLPALLMGYRDTEERKAVFCCCLFCYILLMLGIAVVFFGLTPETVDSNGALNPQITLFLLLFPFVSVFADGLILDSKLPDKFGDNGALALGAGVLLMVSTTLLQTLIYQAKPALWL